MSVSVLLCSLHIQPRRWLFGSIISISFSLLVACGAGENSADEYHQKGVAAYEAGTLITAVIQLKNALLENPEQLKSRQLLGQIYLLFGDAPSAVKEFRYVFDKAPVNPRHRLDLAEALILAGEGKQALQLLEKAEGSVDQRILKGRAERVLNEYAKATAEIHAILSEHPDNIDALKALAQTQWQQGNRALATRYVDKIITLAPNNVSALVIKGRLEYINGDYDASEAALVRALAAEKYDQSSNRNKANTFMAMTLLAKGETDKAEPYIAALGKFVPNSPMHKFLKATVYSRRGDLESAIVLLREVLSQYPKHANTLLLSGVIEVRRNHLDQAKEYLSRALVESPGFIYGRKILGAVYLKLKLTVNAVQILLPLVKAIPDDAEAWGLLGSAYLENGQIDEAMQALNKAVTLNPEATAARTTLAVGLLSSGQTDQAIDELKKVVQQNDDDHRAEYLVVIGLLNKKEFDQAATAAKLLIKKQPENPVLYNLLAVAQANSGHLDDSRENYKKAIKLDSEYLTPALNLANIEINAGRVDEARAIYDKLLLAKPQNLAVLNAKALLLFRTGETDRAIDLWKIVREYHPKDSSSRLALAQIYWNRKDIKLSLNSIREVLQLQPDNAFALLLAARLNLVQGNLDSALSQTAKLQELLPKSARSLYVSALVQARRGQTENSRKLLRKALEINQNLAEAKLALADLNLGTGQGVMQDLFGIGSGKKTKHTPEEYMLLIRQQLGANKLDQALSLARKFKSETPDNLISSFLLAAVYRAKSDFPRARVILTEAQKTKPNNISAQLNLAALEIAAGDKEQARQWFAKVLELQPTNENALMGLASIATGKEALELVSKAHEGNPDSIIPMLPLALYHLSRLELKEAQKLAESLYQHAPSDIRVLNIASRIYLASGDLSKAEARIKTYRDQSPNDAGSVYLTAMLNIARSQFDKGRKMLKEAMALNPREPSIPLALARLEMNRRNYKAAVSSVSKALKLAPNSITAQSLQADIEWRSGNTNGALKAYQKLWKQSPNTDSALKVARALWATGDKNNAEKFLRTRLTANKSNVALRDALADMMFVDARLPEAATEYRKVLEINPNNVGVLNKLAKVYTQSSDDRALSTAKTAYELAPENPEILDTYGWMLVQKGDLNSGLNLLVKAVANINGIRQESEQASARFHLAEAYRKNGDKASARKELELLMSSGVEFPERTLVELTLIRLK